MTPSCCLNFLISKSSFCWLICQGEPKICHDWRVPSSKFEVLLPAFFLNLEFWTQMFSFEWRGHLALHHSTQAFQGFQLWILHQVNVSKVVCLPNIGIIGNSTYHFLTYSCEKSWQKKSGIKREGLLNHYFWGATSEVFWTVKVFWWDLKQHHNSSIVEGSFVWMTRQHPFVFTFIIEWIRGLLKKNNVNSYSSRFGPRQRARCFDDLNLRAARAKCGKNACYHENLRVAPPNTISPPSYITMIPE